MIHQETIITVIIILLIIIVSALPLHLAVSFLGGRSTIFKSFMVMIITAMSSFLINIIFPVFGTLIAWIILIWVFHEVFRLKWLKAIFAWILWIVFVVVFIFLFGLIGLANLLVFRFW